MLKATIYPAADGWRWRVQGLNNEILASGEAYVRRADAESVIGLLFNPAVPVELVIKDHGDKVVDHNKIR